MLVYINSWYKSTNDFEAGTQQLTQTAGVHPLMVEQIFGEQAGGMNNFLGRHPSLHRSWILTYTSNFHSL